MNALKSAVAIYLLIIQASTSLAQPTEAPTNLPQKLQPRELEEQLCAPVQVHCGEQKLQEPKAAEGLANLGLKITSSEKPQANSSHPQEETMESKCNVSSQPEFLQYSCRFEWFLDKELMESLMRTLFSNGRLIPEINQELQNQMQEIIGIPACTPNILPSLVGKFRDQFINKNNLSGYVNLLNNIINAIPESRLGLREKRQFLSRIRELEREGSQIDLGQIGPPPSQNSNGSSPNHGFLGSLWQILGIERRSEQTPPPQLSVIERSLGCMSRRFNLNQYQLSRANQETLFYALFSGNKRVPLRQVSSVLNACKSNKGNHFNICVLNRLGYPAAKEIVQAKTQTGVSFLGYDKDEIEEMLSFWNEYPNVLKKENYDLSSIVKPDSPLSQENRYNGAKQEITMWGKERLKDEILKLTTGPRPRFPQECQKPGFTAYLREEIKKERKYIFLHEVGHSIYKNKFEARGPGNLNKLGQDWNAMSWQQSRDVINTPISCNEIPIEKYVDRGERCKYRGIASGDGDIICQHHGTVSLYGATNPDEEFAETFSTWLTGQPRIHNDLMPRLKPKFDFIKGLFPDRRR